MADLKTYTGPGWFLDYSYGYDSGGKKFPDYPCLFYLAEGVSVTQVEESGIAFTRGIKHGVENELETDLTVVSCSLDYATNAETAQANFNFLKSILDSGGVSNDDPYHITIPTDALSYEGKSVFTAKANTNKKHNVYITAGDKRYIDSFSREDTRDLRQQTTGLLLSVDNGEKVVQQTITYANPDATESVHAEFAKRLNSFSTDTLKDAVRVDKRSILALSNPFLPAEIEKLQLQNWPDAMMPDEVTFSFVARTSDSSDFSKISLSVNEPAAVIKTQDGSEYPIRIENDKDKISECIGKTENTPFEVTYKWAADLEFGEHSVVFKLPGIPAGKSVSDDWEYDFTDYSVEYVY